MLQNSFGVQLTSASVDRGDGSDPRDAAIDVLRRERVLAAVRDGGAQWDAQEEAALLIAVTDDGRVLTLDPADGIETTLTAEELRSAFADAGLTLWLDVGDGPDLDVDTHPAPDGDVEDVDLRESVPAEFDPDDVDFSPFEPTTVRVSTFSHRGPAIARILAAVGRMPVDHLESGDWSLQRFETPEPTASLTTSNADLPLVELNRADTGSWFQVSIGAGIAIPFWTDAERDTRPVLDVDAISVPETAEIYRRLLAEGDGSRDELLEVADRVTLDVDAAHRALLSEALGGVVGTEARERAFLVAFGIPRDLIDAAYDESAGPAARQFTAMSRWAVARETVIAGFGEITPLTRRQRPIARLLDALRRRPALGLALTLGEMTAGVWATSRTRGAGRAVGVLLIVDATIDALVWIARIRRSR
ncbi:MAG: hypothetical protein P0Y60_07630 [Candidatus Microbacterium colombiense]|nr:MAG: hypothetical protein P0Y60_07630 [Microbacterium sp.]